MAAVLVATAEPLNSPPRVRLDVSLPAGSVGVSVYLTRVGPDGRTVPVRLADPALIAGSAWVGYDYEAPYGALCTYSAQSVYYASGGTPRANLIPNPSFEVNTNGWAGIAPVRDTAQSWVGVASARRDTTAQYDSTQLNPALACAASTTYTGSVYVRGTGSARIVLTQFPYQEIATSSTVTLTGAWQRISATGTTAAGATSLTFLIHQMTSGANSLWIDGVLLEEAASAGDYFDGDTPDGGGLTYAWAGTPHNSTSIATTAPPLTETPTDTALVDVADVWLVHPGVPDLSMMLAKVTSLGDRSRRVDRGVFEPFGRADPIVVSDGKRKAVQASLVIRTRTLDELAALVALTADTAPLLLNVPAALGWGLTDEYVSLGDLTESREVAIGADPGRVFTAPYLVVSRPVGGSQAQRTYATVLTEASSYQGILDLHDSYLALLAPTT